MKITAIIQARMASTRLPGKVLLPLNGKPVLQRLVDRVRKSKLINDVVIATSINPKDKEIEMFCRQSNISFYRGDEENVLKRVFLAAVVNRPDIIVEITGDCPLVDPKQIDICINNLIEYKADYSCNIYPRSWPDGFDIQVYTFADLQQLYYEIKPKQHVGWNITQYPNDFKVVNYPAPDEYNIPELRLTLDTKEDLELLQLIFGYFDNEKDYRPTAEEIIELIKLFPKLKEINQGIKAKKPEEG